MIFHYLDDSCKKQSTKEYIKDQFLSEYVEKKNLSRINISGLIRQCGISRGTFYFYFSDIKDLYFQVEDDLIRFITDGLKEVDMATVSGDRTRYIKAYEDYLINWEENKDILYSFFTGSEGWHFFELQKQCSVEHFRTCIQYKTDRELTETEIKMAQFFALGHIGMLSEWIQHGCEMKKNEVAETVANVLFRGWFPEVEL